MSNKITIRLKPEAAVDVIENNPRMRYAIYNRNTNQVYSMFVYETDAEMFRQQILGSITDINSTWVVREIHNA